MNHCRGCYCGVYVAVLAGLLQINCLPAGEDEKKTTDQSRMIQRVLRLPARANNPRNSEGDFITLKDGRILFVYTHFTGGAADHSSAYLAGRYS